MYTFITICMFGRWIILLLSSGFLHSSLHLHLCDAHYRHLVASNASNWLTQKLMCLCYPAEFGCSRSNVTSVIKEICLKIWPLTSCFLRSLKVIKTNTERSATYDFLLTFDRNHEPISFLFPDKRRFHVVESRPNFPNPVYFEPPLKGFPLKWGIGTLDQKTRIMGLPGRERNMMISSAVWIQYAHERDRRTDRHRYGKVWYTTVERPTRHSIGHFGDGGPEQ